MGLSCACLLLLLHLLLSRLHIFRREDCHPRNFPGSEIGEDHLQGAAVFVDGHVARFCSQRWQLELCPLRSLYVVFQDLIGVHQVGPGVVIAVDRGLIRLLRVRVG